MIFGDTNSFNMTTVYLEKIPQDLSDFILKIQCEQRIQKKLGKSYNQSQTVLHIVREYKKIIEKSQK